MWDAAKAVLSGKFMTQITILEKKEGLKDLSFRLKNLKKKRKFKISRCKEIIKIRAKSTNEKTKATERSMQSKVASVR